MTINLNPHLERPLTDANWLSRAERFWIGWNPHLLGVFQKRLNTPLTIPDLHYTDRARLKVYLSARHQPDGSVRWIVESEGFVLCPIGTAGHLGFCVECTPSYRTEDWMKQTRHASPEDALDTFRKFCNQTWNQYTDDDPED